MFTLTVNYFVENIKVKNQKSIVDKSTFNKLTTLFAYGVWSTRRQQQNFSY